MLKRVLSLSLCALVLLGVPLTALAEQAQTGEEIQTTAISITDTEEFLLFADNCRLDSYSRNMTVSLEADIDLSGTDFVEIPIFSGTFEGNRHTISGLSKTGDGSVQGLFRYLTAEAVVRNLNLTGEVQPGGSGDWVGGLAGSNAGTIDGCAFQGTVSGADYVGGLVGKNTLTGVIDNCRVDGSVYGNHFVGGIAGSNQGVIRNSTNNAQINTTPQQNSVGISDITIDTLTNSESADTVTDVGGIAGTSGGVIRRCVNRGDVGYKHMGYNIGGIAGSQMGYIADCDNRGNVSGRKETGGIVGQMEPVALVEFEQDALQILRQQLDDMGKIATQAATNARASAAQMTAQADTLLWHIEDARQAIKELLPDAEDPALPDWDSILAAQNTLSSSLSGMNQALQGMQATSQSAAGKLNNQLSALGRQMDLMRTTLGNVSETMGGSIEDVSDADTESDLGGKVQRCANYGSVLADLNAGGISGAMALENDLDLEEDISISGENSLNFESQLRMVIVDCENRAPVTVTKQNGGGIVGWMQFGLVKDCSNTGMLDAEGSDYVGGIAGLSSSYIRSSSAKCSISGGAYVGGIAGRGTVVSNCRSMVRLSGREKLGAVLGYREEDTQQEDPIRGNLYCKENADFGGIDGISYEEQAQGLSQTEFLALEDLPELFRTVTVQFRFADGTVRTVALASGSALNQSSIPKLPEKEGYIASWEGLEDVDVTFDAVIEAVYTPLAVTIESRETRDGLPRLLAEGAFLPETTLSLGQTAQAPVLSGRLKLLDTCRIEAIQTEVPVTLRYLLPTVETGKDLQLLVRGDGESWQPWEFTLDGSYLVFSGTGSAMEIAVITQTTIPWLWIAAAGAGTLLVLYFGTSARIKKGKDKDPLAGND